MCAPINGPILPRCLLPPRRLMLAALLFVPVPALPVSILPLPAAISTPAIVALEVVAALPAVVAVSFVVTSGEEGEVRQGNKQNPPRQHLSLLSLSTGRGVCDAPEQSCSANPLLLIDPKLNPAPISSPGKATWLSVLWLPVTQPIRPNTRMVWISSSL